MLNNYSGDVDQDCEGHKDSGNTNKSLERNQHKWLQLLQTAEKQ